MEKWALALSILALILSVGRWVFDWLTGNLAARTRGERHTPIQVRVELLASGTNCFLARGGHTLFFVSLRLYSRSGQRAATISGISLDVLVGRRWRQLEPYPADEAVIFKSLVRNALPASIPPFGAEDYYEVYQMPGLLARTTARMRVRVTEYSGSQASLEDTLPLRLDNRPPLDILFQTLDV